MAKRFSNLVSPWQNCAAIWRNGHFETISRVEIETDTIFREHGTGREVKALNGVTLLGSSCGLGWDSIKLDVGISNGWAAHDLTVDGHYLVINLDETPIHFETCQGGDWTAATLPPQGLWSNPERQPFSVRHDQKTFFASCVIDSGFMDEVAGAHYELSASESFTDPVLVGLMRALIASLFDEQNDQTRKTAGDLRRHFAFALATRWGRSNESLIARGGIAPGRLKALKAWIRERLATSLKVEDMADRVGLSPAHFSREFKQTTGMTPWRFVIDLRLEAACEAMSGGAAVGQAAAQCGFSGQAHLTRLFKQHFGIPPSVYLRRQARCRHLGQIGNKAIQ